MMKKMFKLILCLVLMAGFIVSAPSVRASTLSDLEQQNSDLQNQINSTQKNIVKLQTQVNDAQSLVISLDAQSAATQKEINLLSSQLDVTAKQISQTQDQIAKQTAALKEQKTNLFETLTVYYENQNNKQSIFETLLGSESLSSAIDKAKYLETIGGSLTDEINKINKIMADLQTQNQNLENQKIALDKQKSDVVDKQRNINILAKQKQQTLNQIAASKDQAKLSLKQLYGEQNSVTTQIYDLRRQQGGYSGGGTGGYPWANADPNGVDPWGFYYRQCTSFAAWYWNNVEGKAWYNTRPGSGSAWNWPAMASDQGYGVYSSPHVGDIVSWPAGGLLGSYGHVAIVTAVNGDGTFRAAQYNWSPLAYSEMNVSGSMASAARFIR